MILPPRRRPAGPWTSTNPAPRSFPTSPRWRSSPLDGKEIWAGSSDGLVHVTTDGGAHWNAVRPPALPDWSRISAIEPSHTAKGTAWLTASRYMWDDFRPYVYKTTDYGRHWTAMTDGLPDDQYVLALRQDPDASNLLFAGTKNIGVREFRWRRALATLEAEPAARAGARPRDQCAPGRAGGGHPRPRVLGAGQPCVAGAACQTAAVRGRRPVPVRAAAGLADACVRQARRTARGEGRGQEPAVRCDRVLPDSGQLRRQDAGHADLREWRWHGRPQLRSSSQGEGKQERQRPTRAT